MMSLVRFLIIFDLIGHLVTQDDNDFIDDMILSPKQAEYFRTDDKFRIVFKDDKYRWPKGRIPYFLDSKLTKKQIANLQAAMKLIENESCVRFTEVKSGTNPAVSIVLDPNRCSADVGFLDDVTTLSLNAKCLMKPEKIIHELLHVVGFLHQQNSPNRDEYIKIFWENIVEEKKINFEKFTRDQVTEFDSAYDYHSIMHYKENSFSKNEKKTMEALDGVTRLGPIGRMTATDIAKLNKMYKNIC